MGGGGAVGEGDADVGELRGVLDEVGDELLRDAVELVGLGGGQSGPVVVGGGGAEGDGYVAHFVELAGQGGEGLVEGGKGGVGGHELVGDVAYVLTHGVELLGGLGGGGGVGYLHFGHEEVVAHAIVELLCQTFALGFDAVDVAAGLFELGLALLVAVAHDGACYGDDEQQGGYGKACAKAPLACFGLCGVLLQLGYFELFFLGIVACSGIGYLLLYVELVKGVGYVVCLAVEVAGAWCLICALVGAGYHKHDFVAL